MKKQELYDAWKEKKHQVTTSESFINKVMEQAYQYEQKKRETSFNMRWFVDLISAHPMAQAALVAVGAMTGFIRVVFIILVVLSKGDING